MKEAPALGILNESAIFFGDWMEPALFFSEREAPLLCCHQSGTTLKRRGVSRQTLPAPMRRMEHSDPCLINDPRHGCAASAKSRSVCCPPPSAMYARSRMATIWPRVKPCANQQHSAKNVRSHLVCLNRVGPKPTGKEKLLLRQALMRRRHGGTEGSHFLGKPRPPVGE